MSGLIPFNRRKNNLSSSGISNFYDALDDFFNDNWIPTRSLMMNTFKIDVKETENEYHVEAELPGVKKGDINLSLDEGNLSISVSKNENINKDVDNYIHRERRSSSMSRCIHLSDADDKDIKAKLENGVLLINIKKKERTNGSHKIEIE